MTSLKTVFGCDLRTLALVRVCVAAVIIADLIIRATTFTAHYTDVGAVPRAALFLIRKTVPASLHMLSGSPWVMAALFLFAGLTALALMLGYRSRLAAFISWMLLISLDTRNQFIGQGGDMLLRTLLFWLMFLPIGARCSIDAALDKFPPADNAYFSMATLGLLLQAMSVYFFTALLKSDPVWLGEGTAVYYALSNDTLVLPFGEWLLQYPGVLGGLTYLVWWLELLAPLLMFSPVLHLPLRLLGLTLLVGMHIGFLLCLDIGLFPFISISSLLAFTPSLLWQWLQQKNIGGRGRDIRIYFDGECQFCEKIVLILRSLLILPQAEVAPAQDDPIAYALMQRHNSWVVYAPSGEAYLRWPALVWLLSASPLFAALGKLLSVGLWRGVGERFYRWVAAHRDRFSQLSAVLLPFREPRYELTPLAQLVCIGFILVTLWVNVGSLKIERLPVPAMVRSVADSLRLSQRWTMFAPTPSKLSGWFVAVGESRDGRPVDVFGDRLEAPRHARERYLELNYDSYRWRKFLARLPLEERVELRPFYVQYLCRNWNADHAVDQRLRWIKLYFVAERIGAPGAPRTATRKLIWQSHCGSDPVAEVVNLRRGVLPKLS